MNPLIELKTLNKDMQYKANHKHGNSEISLNS